MEAAADAKRAPLMGFGDPHKMWPWLNFRDSLVPPLWPQPQDAWAFFSGWEHCDEGPSLVLDIPEGPRRPDSFYVDVANLYRRVAVRARRPAEELATANGVPVTTVHRWVKEARRRGLLLSSQREALEFYERSADERSSS
jgi:hypothetical protein